MPTGPETGNDVPRTTRYACPETAQVIGEFGAEVIKVEQPATGDPMCNWGDQKNGVGLVWKKSVAQ